MPRVFSSALSRLTASSFPCVCASCKASISVETLALARRLFVSAGGGGGLVAAAGGVTICAGVVDAGPGAPGGAAFSCWSSARKPAITSLAAPSVCGSAVKWSSGGSSGNVALGLGVRRLGATSRKSEEDRGIDFSFGNREPADCSMADWTAKYWSRLIIREPFIQALTNCFETPSFVASELCRPRS